MLIRKESFGKVRNEQVYLFTLKNDEGIIVKITNYGGIITSLSVPDNRGKLDNVVLGFDDLKDYTNENYLKSCPYFGAIIGRYANRIAKGKFTLDGKEYQITCNDGENSLHGGVTRFDKMVWLAQEITNDHFVGLKLSCLSKDNEEGYPGNLTVEVTYSLNNANELKISYKATTDKATPVNFTNHSYFNLAGAGNILNHILTINADKITEVNDALIPIGEIKEVQGTPYDFTKPKRIGLEIAKTTNGYDMNFVLNKENRQPSFAARVFEPKTGRILEVYTTEPGIQFYSGNSLDSLQGGNKHAGLALETQHFPDSPHHPDFPSTILNPGEVYHSETIYKFRIA